MVFTLTDDALYHLCQQPSPAHSTTTELLSIILDAYDRRSGGLETQNRVDKQRLGLTHRNKQRFAAQEMLVLFAQLAHNVIIWSRRFLIQVDPGFHHFGMLRMVRDIFHIPGLILLDSDGAILTPKFFIKHLVIFSPSMISRLFWQKFRLLSSRLP